MPYYVIERYKVFLSHSRLSAINEIALAHKDPFFRVSSTTEGNPEVREADELRFQYLTNLCRKNRTRFYQEWVKFDLRGQEAQENAWDLLYDYCALTRIGNLEDTRSEVHAILAEYAGDSYTYPMGRIFALRVPGRHSLASLLQLKPRPMLKLDVDTSKIVSASGTLEDFCLQFRHCTFKCGKEFSVVSK